MPANPDLRLAITDRALPVERKSDLITELLKEKTSVEAARLITHVVTEPRGRSFEANIERVAAAAAALRQRQVATVTSAVPLNEQQRDRLAVALSASFGYDVQLNVVVNPDVVGGLRVSLGDELIDGTLASQLSDAQRRIAG